jgi:hypothetical protein
VGKSLFQYLQHFRRVALPRFADEQVDVFRHDHVAEQPEFVPRTHLVEYFYKPIACASRTQEWAATVTTKRNEVEIASSVEALQRVAHRSQTRTLENPQGCGTQIRRAELSVLHPTIEDVGTGSCES